MKKWLSLLLAVLLLVTLSGHALAAPAELSSAEADKQLSFIYSQLASMKQDEDKDKVASLTIKFDDITRKNHIYASSTLGTLIGEDALLQAAY